MIKWRPPFCRSFPDAAWKVAVKMNTAGIGNTIAGVRNVWNKFSPEYPIEYKFLDENFEEMYNSEDKLRSLLWIFTGIAIFVGCLGLFGLAAYTAERRRKEVGIRKSAWRKHRRVGSAIVQRFYQVRVDFVVIASPVAFIFMNKWLQNFAYRINISGWVFVIAASLQAIAFITVSFQAMRAALANPVRSLRTE